MMRALRVADVRFGVEVAAFEAAKSSYLTLQCIKLVGRLGCVGITRRALT